MHGRIAYEAYRAHTDGRSLVSGAILPTWSDLDPSIQSAWNVAADAVLEHSMSVHPIATSGDQ